MCPDLHTALRLVNASALRRPSRASIRVTYPRLLATQTHGHARFLAWPAGVHGRYDFVSPRSDERVDGCLQVVCTLWTALIRCQNAHLSCEASHLHMLLPVYRRTGSCMQFSGASWFHLERKCVSPSFHQATVAGQVSGTSAATACLDARVPWPVGERPIIAILLYAFVAKLPPAAQARVQTYILLA